MNILTSPINNKLNIKSTSNPTNVIIEPIGAEQDIYVQTPSNLSGIDVKDINAVKQITVETGKEYDKTDVPTYTGVTEATPSTERQVFNTAGKVVLKNFVVNPIPSNYGLVTWNGSVLTVS